MTIFWCLCINFCQLPFGGVGGQLGSIKSSLESGPQTRQESLPQTAQSCLGSGLFISPSLRAPPRGFTNLICFSLSLISQPLP